MKFIEAKKDSDVKLAGVRAEIDWKGASQRELTLRDDAGNTVKVSGTFGSIEVLVPAPPAMVTKYRIAGRIPGITEGVLEYHDSELDAKDTLRGVEKALPGLEHELKIERVDVTEDEAEAHPPRLYEAKAAAEMPF